MFTEWVTLCKKESCGAIGSFGIEIRVAGSNLPDLKQDSIEDAVYNAINAVSAEVKAAIKVADPRSVDETNRNRELINLFTDPIFVEEIPNGYCGDWCCRHLPWFIVTTKVGRFKIGWRKRVILIDWHDTVDTGSVYDLFQDEDVTKGGKFIHAWSMDEAKQYIDKILR